MAGEFVRTPKRGEARGRYRQVAKLPFAEMALALVSAASVVAAIETRHYFATPFAALFTVGYGYVATLVLQEPFLPRPTASCRRATRSSPTRAWRRPPESKAYGQSRWAGSPSCHETPSAETALRPRQLSSSKTGASPCPSGRSALVWRYGRRPVVLDAGRGSAAYVWTSR